MRERLSRVREVLGPPDAMEQEFHAEFNRQVALAGDDTKAVTRMKDKKDHIYGVILREDQLMSRMRNKIERTEIPLYRPTVFAAGWWHDYMRMYEMRMQGTFSSGYPHAEEAAEALLSAVRSNVLYEHDPKWRAKEYNISVVWWSVKHHSDPVLSDSPVPGWQAIDFFTNAHILRAADVLDLAGTPGYMFRAIHKDKLHDPVISDEVLDSYALGEPIKNPGVKRRAEGILRTERFRRNSPLSAANIIWQEEQISPQLLGILPHWGVSAEQFDRVVTSAIHWAQKDGYPFTKQSVEDFVTLYDRNHNIGVYDLDS